jgi:hypothetical protein
MDESALIERLRRIEALHAGATTDGERLAAAEAKGRIQQRLREVSRSDPAIEFRFTLADGWSRKLFVALCRRYEVDPYRYRGQRRTTVMAKVSRRFVEETLWPEFEQLSSVLRKHLEEITERLISTAIHENVSEADEVVGLPRLPGPGSDDPADEEALG